MSVSHAVPFFIAISMNEYAGTMMARSNFPYKSSNLLSPLLASLVLQVQEIGAQKDLSLVTCLKR